MQSRSGAGSPVGCCRLKSTWCKSAFSMAETVSIRSARAGLSRLISRAEAGEEIVIARRGKPVAILVGVRRNRKPLPWGVFKGKIRMAADFDAPLDGFQDLV